MTQGNGADKDRVREELLELVAELGGPAGKMARDPSGREALVRAWRIAHTLAQGAEMVGLEQAALLARAAELAYTRLLDASAPAPGVLVEVTAGLAVQLPELLASEPSEEALKAGQDLAGQFKRIQAKGVPVSGDVEEATPQFDELTGELAELAAEAGQYLDDIKAGQGRDAAVRGCARALHTLAVGGDVLDGKPSLASVKALDPLWQDVVDREATPSDDLLARTGRALAELGATVPAAEPAKTDASNVLPNLCFGISFRYLTPEGVLLVTPLDILEELRVIGPARMVPAMADMDEIESLGAEVTDVWWRVGLLVESLKDLDEAENAVRDVFLFVEDKAEVTLEQVPDSETWLAEFEAGQAEEPAPEPASEPGPEPEPEPAPESKLEPEPESVLATEPGKPESVEEEQDREPAQEPVAKAEPPRPEPAPEPRARVEKSAPPAEAAQPRADTVDVDLHKLDHMVDLVGELVMAQAQLLQISERLRDPALTNVSEEMERLSSLLRDRTMSMRMLPLGAAFEELKQVAFDWAGRHGKKVEVLCRGEETELEKKVIEQLVPPLAQLLRNAVEHGVEAPEQRRKAGKPDTGLILLSAEHSGGNVVLTVADNGRGFRAEEILARALDRGLIQDPAQVPEGEVFGLMFLQGYASGKDGSSDQDAGLDVFKDAVDALRGTVEIESEPGKGTKFTVKLPLSLAIIEGLQVRVSGEYYVLPLAAIEECVELTRKDRNGDGKRLINLRGQIVPYIRLREWFEVPGQRPEIEQIVVTGDGRRRIGIVVDEVIGQQQTVIKSLGTLFKRQEEIAGATVRGDGSLALILDLSVLVRMARDAANAENR